MTFQKPASITRTELHALVWSQPRSKLAGIWGISDVAIGKLCAKECIPAPPPGYWAKKAAGGRVSTTPLPMRLPGQSEVIETGAANYRGWWNAPINPDSEIAPPSYAETVEEVVASALARLGPFRARRDLADPHQGLNRVLQSESKRAENRQQSEWSLEKPRFVEPRFQRQFRIFNSIFFILDSIRASCEVGEKQTWIQGLGDIHHLVARVCVGGSSVQLQFLEPENPKGNRELPRSEITTLRAGSNDKGVDFADAPGAKIEKRLQEIVRTILTIAEDNMRSGELWTYEKKLERKSQLLAEIAEKNRKAQEMRLAEIKARKEAITKEIVDAAAALRQAQDIRDLVAAMAAHPDCAAGQSEQYLAWSRAVLAEADLIDPMLQPFSQSFRAWEGTGPVS
jgi:hypothetical protein